VPARFVVYTAWVVPALRVKARPRHTGAVARRQCLSVTDYISHTLGPLTVGPRLLDRGWRQGQKS